MTSVNASEAGTRLGDLVALVRSSGQRVTIVDNGSPAAMLVHPLDVRSCDETISLLSNDESMRRISAAELAMQTGDLLAGADLAVIDPEHRWLKQSGPRSASTTGEGALWDLQVSGPASRAVAKLPGHVRDMLLRFVSEALLVRPLSVGVELRGRLRRRYLAQVETQLILYQLDSVKQSVRVIEVLQGPGLVGHTNPAGRRW